MNMIYHKKTALFIALMSACQIQAAAHAGKLAKGAAVALSIGGMAVWGKKMTCRDEPVKKNLRESALDMLKTGNCTLSFFYDVKYTEGESITFREGKAVEHADPQCVYNDFSVNKELKTRRVEDLFFCLGSNSSCLFLGNATRQELVTFLEQGGMTFDPNAEQSLSSKSKQICMIGR